MDSYDVFTIVHPPYFKFLDGHLDSIKHSLGERTNKVYLLSTQTEKSDQSKLESIVSGSKIDVTLESTPEKSTIGSSRNRIFRKGNSDWAVFLDADIMVNGDYFENLEGCIEKYGKHASGLAGGIGTSDSSRFGLYEGAMDLRVYLRNLNISREEFEYLNQRLNFQDLALGNEIEFYRRAREALKGYEGQSTTAFQGFNQIIKREDLEGLGGFDERFWSAEDRELGLRFNREGKKIVFTPSIWVNHDYNFNLGDILRRKKIHGVWYGELRRKFPEEEKLQMGARRWGRNFMRSFNPPEPFRGIDGRVYFTLAFLTYMSSSILSQKLGLAKIDSSSGGWTYGRDK
mgnify:CR=1 FL=1